FTTMRFLDSLNTDAGIDQLPIFGLGRGIKDTEHLHAPRHALGSLLNKVFYKIQIVDSDSDKGGNVVGLYGEKKIGPASFLMEKFSRPRRERPKEERSPSIQNPGVKV